MMKVERDIGKAPHTRSLAGQVADLRGGCVGCIDCQGLCRDLIDTLTVPGIVLKGKAA